MKVNVGVGVFIFKGDKFLMGKRKGAHGEGSWSVPGGWIEFGETFEQAAAREVLEETTLKIRNIKPVGVTNNIFRDEAMHSVTVWLVSDYEKGKPQIAEPDKFVEQGWFNFENLPEPLFLPWEELFKADFLDEIKKHISDK